jgi:hypothetical protein
MDPYAVPTSVASSDETRARNAHNLSIEAWAVLSTYRPRRHRSVRLELRSKTACTRRTTSAAYPNPERREQPADLAVGRGP